MASWFWCRGIFEISDEDDAQRLIKKIIKERYVLSKEELSALVKKVLRSRDLAQEEDARSNEKVASILDLYKERLLKVGAIDFSGLLIKLLELLENEEGIRLLGNRLRHLVVDEYQDINAIQSRIVHILADKAETVAIVWG